METLGFSETIYHLELLLDNINRISEEKKIAKKILENIIQYLHECNFKCLYDLSFRKNFNNLLNLLDKMTVKHNYINFCPSLKFIKQLKDFIFIEELIKIVNFITNTNNKNRKN